MIEESKESATPKDNHFGVSLDQIAHITKPEPSTSTTSELKEFLDVISTLGNNPDLILKMPKLVDNTDPENIRKWMDIVGVSNLEKAWTREDILGLLVLSPEVLADLPPERVTVRDLFESIRFEFAKRIFANRKIEEANDLLKMYISEELVLVGQPRVAFFNNFVGDPYEIPRVLGNAGYKGKAGEIILFELEFEEGVIDKYFDPLHTFDEAIEHEITWTMAHEIVHWWLQENSNLSVFSGMFSQKDLDTIPVEVIVERIKSDTLERSRNLTDLAHALDEGLAVFIQTKVSDADIKNCKDPDLKKKLIEKRKELYLTHRKTSHGISPYYEGFYQIVRRIRQQTKTTDQMIQLFSHIDYSFCRTTSIEDDQGMDNVDGYKYVKNPSLIPLIVSDKNLFQTVGEYDQAQKSK